MTTDDDQAWEGFVSDVRKHVVQQMAESAFVMTIAPSGEPDIKLAVETGLAVLLDKPIIPIAMRGVKIPPGLLRIAHQVIELKEDLDTEAGQAELRRKLDPIIAELAA